MTEYSNYLQAAGGLAILIALLVWVKKSRKK
jgi:LPXTG-motif cell wall-anchored protein